MMLRQCKNGKLLCYIEERKNISYSYLQDDKKTSKKNNIQIYLLLLQYTENHKL